MHTMVGISRICGARMAPKGLGGELDIVGLEITRKKYEGRYTFEELEGGVQILGAGVKCREMEQRAD